MCAYRARFPCMVCRLELTRCAYSIAAHQSFQVRVCRDAFGAHGVSP